MAAAGPGASLGGAGVAGAGAGAGLLRVAAPRPLEQQWYDPRCHPNDLVRDTPLHYFMQPDSNPFYDRKCNNQRLMMSNQNVLDRSKLLQMKGIEYEHVFAQEPVLHLIRKQKRTSPAQAMPLCLYYMVRGSVFQSPDVRTVLNSHLRAALFHLENGLTKAQSHARYHPIRGPFWSFGPEDEAAATAEEDRSGAEAPPPDTPAEAAGADLLSKFKANPYASRRTDHTKARVQFEMVEGLIGHVDRIFPNLQQGSAPQAYPTRPSASAQGQQQSDKRKAAATGPPAASKRLRIARHD